MKKQLLFIFMAFSLPAFFLLSNSGGRAASSNQGNTGAPGDQSIGGQPFTCANANCHGVGSVGTIQTSTLLELLDQDGNDVSGDGYEPGQTYELRVTVDVLNGDPAGYGYQVVCLNAPEGEDGPDVPSWSDPADNVQVVTTTTTSRTYAEHKGVSASNVFSVQWTAPAAGSGAVTFYSCGNGVNGNGTSGGDGASCAALEVAEGMINSLGELTMGISEMQLFPNPVRKSARLQLQVVEAGDYAWRIVDLEGKVRLNGKEYLTSGMHQLDLPVRELPAGLYQLNIGRSGEGVGQSLKMVKM